MVALIGGRRARLPQQLAASSRRLPPIPARPPLQPRWRRFRASLVLCWCQRRLRAAPCNPAVPANQSHPRCRPWRIRLCLQGCRPRHQPVCGHQNHNPHRLRPPGGHASQSCKQCGGGGLSCQRLCPTARTSWHHVPLSALDAHTRGELTRLSRAAFARTWSESSKR